MNKYKDKLQHFTVCLIATIFMCGAAKLFTTPYNAMTIAAALSIGLSLGKEYGDKGAPSNHWCWWDLLADAFGILTALAIDGGILLITDKI